MHSILSYITLIAVWWALPVVELAQAFVAPATNSQTRLPHRDGWSAAPLMHASSVKQSEVPRAPPRTGFLQSMLDLVLDSPVWTYVLVPQARKKMVDTAADNGIPWKECRAWLESKKDGPWNVQSDTIHDGLDIPEYYKQSFHAYERGNLCWDAALEVEIASKAVGARNFPKYGREGETAFRDSFETALQENGATCPSGGIVIDLGCGTGISTRRLAANYPQASRIQGIDMSPYYCEVGKFLLNKAPLKSIEEDGQWVNAVENDSRIAYEFGDAANTGLPDNSVDVVNLLFVAHELPFKVTLNILKESHRILKEGGQLWFCEMDFETPGYSAQRANPLLFSLIRSTEPYLDDYADHAQDIRDCLRELYSTTRMAPATGRHFAVVATKDSAAADHTFEDSRFDEDGIYRVEDTHLKVFENKI